MRAYFTGLILWMISRHASHGGYGATYGSSALGQPVQYV